ncbi:MAG: pyridoxamine 5'-phosphate oxidase family protein [Gammaproteobacteria bacterium]|nr:pyridoxamine 5'-phosphate oxidase family protein [Gammaproteobacteria bacterium]
MGKLTTEIKLVINHSRLLPFATSSRSGIPNVIPVKFVFIENDNELWIIDNFMSKTLINLQQNPQAALYIYAADKNICCQIKGNVSIQTSGVYYDRMRENIHKIDPKAPARSLIIFSVTEIYQCMPGNNVGERIN